MCHSTPATYLVWSLLSCLMGIFLIYHLWCFDRFKCIRWSQGTQGTFMRVMTYSYLLSVPLLITYAVGFCIIKYSEGFVTLPVYGVIPMPYELWTHAHRQAITPLYFCISIAWALEMVTHLEELCFWLFVVNARPKQKDWFNSPYFKIWVAGSGVAILYMPLVTIITRSDPIKCEAWTFLAGGLGSLALTISFLPVLHLFQPFLGGLRKEGVDMNTIIRLTKFHELNTIRVVFRLIFAFPLLILAVDGVRHNHPINQSFFGSEFLSVLAGFGLIISSAITLVIFFPRSIENEIAAQDAGIRSRGFFASRNHLTFVSQEQELYGTYDPEDVPMDSKTSSPSSPSQKHVPFPSVPPSSQDLMPAPSPLLPRTTSPMEPVRLAPNRRPPSPEDVKSPQPSPRLSNPDRFNNPATKVSRSRSTFR